MRTDRFNAIQGGRGAKGQKGRGRDVILLGEDSEGSGGDKWSTADLLHVLFFPFSPLSSPLSTRLSSRLSPLLSSRLSLPLSPSFSAVLLYTAPPPGGKSPPSCANTWECAVRDVGCRCWRISDCSITNGNRFISAPTHTLDTTHTHTHTHTHNVRHTRTHARAHMRTRTAA